MSRGGGTLPVLEDGSFSLCAALIERLRRLGFDERVGRLCRNGRISCSGGVAPCSVVPDTCRTLTANVGDATSQTTEFFTAAILRFPPSRVSLRFPE